MSPLSHWLETCHYSFFFDWKTVPSLSLAGNLSLLSHWLNICPFSLIGWKPVLSLKLAEHLFPDLLLVSWLLLPGPEVRAASFSTVSPAFRSRAATRTLYRACDRKYKKDPPHLACDRKEQRTLRSSYVTEKTNGPSAARKWQKRQKGPSAGSYVTEKTEGPPVEAYENLHSSGDKKDIQKRVAT